MKPKYFLALGLLVLGLGSCGESFFEQYPSNNITEGNFYKTDDDFNQGVVACYAKLKTQMSFHLTEIGYRGDENVLESNAGFPGTNTLCPNFFLYSINAFLISSSSPLKVSAFFIVSKF